MKEFKQITISEEELNALQLRLESGQLKAEDYKLLIVLVQTLQYINNALENKNTSIKRLLRLVFGAKTESTANVLKQEELAEGAEHEKSEGPPNKEVKGHGRNGAEKYSGARKVKVEHKKLKAGCDCPLCLKGKVYPMERPGIVLCITGNPPVSATVYELEKLRCNLCGAIFSAKAPEEAGTKKYDETVGTTIALLKYGNGFPFYRLEKLQESLGVPLAASTQWEIVEKKSKYLLPAYEQLIKEAAGGEVIHNDDTRGKVLELLAENKAGREADERTGIFTTGILSVVGERRIALYYTGREHAGENMRKLLNVREAELGPPIQMCDALSRNYPKDLNVILANCLVHARRNFVDVTDIFPLEVEFILNILKEVYKNDAKTKEERMSGTKRLDYHKRHSASLMEKLHSWLEAQVREKNVEPNSGLGEAIAYMLKHWAALTLFLRKPNAPLDNNICEQMLKKAILHRKNSYFYKTMNGAYVGDMYMSLIHSCTLNKTNPYNYLNFLEKYATDVAENPGLWMPWNWENRLPELKT
jgi:transposase